MGQGIGVRFMGSVRVRVRFKGSVTVRVKDRVRACCLNVIGPGHWG